jgi:hypothetical protein
MERLHLERFCKSEARNASGITLIVAIFQFSVGSYVNTRLDFSNMSPACNIYAIELHIVQTYSAVPIEEYKMGVYDPEEYMYPSDTFVLHKVGEKPLTNRPGKGIPTLWTGSSGMSNGQVMLKPPGEENRYIWETEKIRLPVASNVRPSTCDGYVFHASSIPLHCVLLKLGCTHSTKSPVHIKHKFVVKVYFSVTGERLDGSPIGDGAAGTGELRLLIVNLPQHLPSVRPARLVT